MSDHIRGEHVTTLKAVHPIHPSEVTQQQVILGEMKPADDTGQGSEEQEETQEQMVITAQQIIPDDHSDLIQISAEAQQQVFS